MGRGLILVWGGRCRLRGEVGGGIGLFFWRGGGGRGGLGVLWGGMGGGGKGSWRGLGGERGGLVGSGIGEFDLALWMRGRCENELYA